MEKYKQYLESSEWEFVPYKQEQIMSYSGKTIREIGGQGFPTVEVEGGENITLPNGFSENIQGDSHAQGGIPLNLQPETKIFSEKLKHPEKKKSYAKLAKKFETKKDFDAIDSKYSDKTNIETANLNIQLKNLALDNLFAEQEEAKLSGEFGKKIANEAAKEYGMMKHGGKVKQYADGGKKKADNNPPLAGTKGIGQDLFAGDLDNVYANAKALGYRGSKDIGSLQSWAKTVNPRAVSDYMLTVKPNKKAEEIWKKEYSKTEPVDLSKMTPQERLEAFGDNLWDFRFPKVNTGIPAFQPTNTQPVTKTSDVVNPITANTSSGFNLKRGAMPNINLSIPTVDAYRRDPITTYPVNPQYVNQRYLDIQPQINEINEGVGAINMNVGDRTGSSIANLLQAQTNAYKQKQQLFGQKYNYDKQQDQWAEGTNAQTKMNVDQFNLNNYIQNARNPQLMRESAIQGDKSNRISEQVALNRDLEHESNVQNYLSDIYDTSGIMPDLNTYNNPATQNFDDVVYKNVNGAWVPVKATDKKKYGGKIKIKPKKK